MTTRHSEIIRQAAAALVSRAIFGGVKDAKPEVNQELSQLRADARAAITAGVEDALEGLHELLVDDDEPKVRVESNGHGRVKLTPKRAKART